MNKPASLVVEDLMKIAKTYTNKANKQKNFGAILWELNRPLIVDPHNLRFKSDSVLLLIEQSLPTINNYDCLIYPAGFYTISEAEEFKRTGNIPNYLPTLTLAGYITVTAPHVLYLKDMNEHFQKLTQ